MPNNPNTEDNTNNNKENRNKNTNNDSTNNNTQNGSNNSTQSDSSNNNNNNTQNGSNNSTQSDSSNNSNNNTQNDSNNNKQINNNNKSNNNNENDKDIAMDMLITSKSTVTALAKVLTEATNPQIRETLRNTLTASINSHYRLSDIALAKGWYNAYADPQQQLQQILSEAQQITK